MTPEEIRVIVEVGHDAGIKVTAHTPKAGRFISMKLKL
jgi:hypothetical protein